MLDDNYVFCPDLYLVHDEQKEEKYMVWQFNNHFYVAEHGKYIPIEIKQEEDHHWHLRTIYH